MKLPIALALGWPHRVPGSSTACDFSTASSWTFEPVDNVVFPAIDLARRAGTAGGSLTAVYNAANEAAAEGFFDGRIAFPRIVEIIGRVLDDADQWRKTRVLWRRSSALMGGTGRAAELVATMQR